ncbi:KIR protein [Plasmodium coatneyi]|uniref:KIR protein n=1 Tax=Plasmodium coatneyi TaxID=208452 RepID=A0A1B1E5C8_9APIC|nr:KIR protein [Plasmodium coatneyi]ANQ10234.1 KIR protein [Plasmodium coatneyi]
MVVQDQDQGQHCKLEDLPSQKIYNHFKNDGNECKDSASKVTEIRNILEDKLGHNIKHEVRKYAEKITGAWCLLSKVKTEEEPSPPPPPPCKVGVLCDFFYYWLGDKLNNNLSFGTSLQDIMQKIYAKLERFNELCTNNSVHINMDKEFEPRRKAIFDYYYDYRTIWKNLRESGSNSCNGAYDTYLKGDKGVGGVGGADDAYNQVEASCPDDGGDDYFCTEFWKKKFKNESNPIPKPGDLVSKAAGGAELPSNGEDDANLLSCLEVLSSKVATMRKEALSHLSPSSQEGDGGGSGVAPIVSSIIGTLIGIPALGALFLYKYNLLPSWLHNHFGNNNNSGGRTNTRKRRSTEHHHYDTLTDESTEYTTDYSTTTNSITDSMTEYSAPSSTRRTNNRNGQKNIRYQSV